MLKSNASRIQFIFDEFFSSVESNFKKIRNCIETKKNRVEKNQFFANLCLGDFPDLELIGSEQNNHRRCFFSFNLY